MIGEWLASRFDGWQNLLTGLALESKDHRLGAKFTRGPRRDPSLVDAQYEEDWLFARIIDTVPDHATRKFIQVTIDDSADEDLGLTVRHRLEELDVANRFFDLMRFDGLDGGACMVLGADDGADPATPLNVARVRRVRHLNVVRRHEIQVERLDEDPNSEYYGEPEYYRFSRTQQRIHASRVIRLVSIPAGPWSPYRDNGWGVPRIQRLYDEMRSFGTLFDYVEGGFKDLTQGALSIKGLANILGHADGETRLKDRLRLMQMTASVFNAVLLDADEKFEKRTSGTMAGYSDVMLRFMDKLASASEIPISILFTNRPTGFATDNDADKRTFYDSVANKQRRWLNKPVERVLEVVMHEQEGPTGGTPPKNWSWQWQPLEEENEKETAERRKTEAETDTHLVDAGLITLGEARSRLVNDAKTPYVLDLELDLDAKEEPDPEPDPEPNPGDPDPDDPPAPDDE
ncbi:MAG: DUF1073 domain-containing protein [Deltaproteobacteria bacterium]|nr:DUF1073 domain-containing protein [Deltaproteobacteria bacterium]